VIFPDVDSDNLYSSFLHDSFSSLTFGSPVFSFFPRVRERASSSGPSWYNLGSDSHLLSCVMHFFPFPIKVFFFFLFSRGPFLSPPRETWGARPFRVPVLPPLSFPSCLFLQASVLKAGKRTFACVLSESISAWARPSFFSRGEFPNAWGGEPKHPRANVVQGYGP